MNESIDYNTIIDLAIYNSNAITEFIKNLKMERRALIFSIIVALLDSGKYDLEVDKNTLNALEGYNLLIQNDDDKVKFSVIFPEQKPEDLA
jgi:hypothetical protein